MGGSKRKGENLTATEQGGFEAILAGYASGTLPRALHALVGAHLELSPRNRAYVARLEEALGRDIAGAECCAIRDREKRLDAIFCCDDMRQGKRETPCGTPRALQHLIGCSIETLPFRRVLPGIHEFKVATADAVEAKLIRVQPGKRIPQHSHDGAEVTLVLAGAFSDASGCYRRGDVAYADEHVDHHPIAEPGEECLCFAVLEAPLRLTGPLGRLLNPFLRT
jgi:putative transcriptional regulator